MIITLAQVINLTLSSRIACPSGWLPPERVAKVTGSGPRLVTAFVAILRGASTKATQARK
jgi:hypothetical protein